MCQTRAIPRSMGLTGCTCGCCGCGCGPGFRRFFSNQEEREYLENYRNQIEKELAEVEKRIKECTCK